MRTYHSHNSLSIFCLDASLLQLQLQFSLKGLPIYSKGPFLSLGRPRLSGQESVQTWDGLCLIRRGRSLLERGQRSFYWLSIVYVQEEMKTFYSMVIHQWQQLVLFTSSLQQFNEIPFILDIDFDQAQLTTPYPHSLFPKIGTLSLRTHISRALVSNSESVIFWKTVDAIKNAHKRSVCSIIWQCIQKEFIKRVQEWLCRVLKERDYRCQNFSLFDLFFGFYDPAYVLYKLRKEPSLASQNQDFPVQIYIFNNKQVHTTLLKRTFWSLTQTYNIGQHTLKMQQQDGRVVFKWLTYQRIMKQELMQLIMSRMLDLYGQQFIRQEMHKLLEETIKKISSQKQQNFILMRMWSQLRYVSDKDSKIVVLR